ncbi:MAG: Transposase, wcw_0483 family [Nitrospira sp.]|nr:MAG: Transposase, wcw_0483 family [Nitrospira sp.]
MGTKTVSKFMHPGIPVPASDALTDVLREGARRMLREAVEAEVQELLTRHASLKDGNNRQRVVRNGYLPERTIQTGLGDIAVTAPRVRDREGAIRFSSQILPPYLRRTKSLAELLPWLYLRGISTGDFGSVLTSVLGQDAAGLSAATIQRLKESWKEDHRQWATRQLSKTYVYLWADGIHFNVRMDEATHCVLVVIGATVDGKKELLAIQDGYRESEQSWKELLLDLKHRGLSVDPKLAIGDGALGFWKALPQVFGETREQRCWVHKTANVLNKLPTANQPKAKSELHQIWMADTKHAAHKAVDSFISAYAAKYPKATACLVQDQDALLAFYDFPAEHWVHIRTTNPIESTFATVRHRTVKTRGCVSRESMLSMVFKLAVVAEQRWRRLKGSKRVGEVLRGVVFKNGVNEEEQERAA